jgi:hypothetical protein
VSAPPRGGLRRWNRPPRRTILIGRRTIAQIAHGRADCYREPVSARTEAARSVPRRAANNPAATMYTRPRNHGGCCTNQLNAQSMPPVSLRTVFESRNNGSSCRADARARRLTLRRA